MAAIAAAFLIGGLVGLFVRPVIDAYLNWKTAALWRDSDEAPIPSEPQPATMLDENIWD